MLEMSGLWSHRIGGHHVSSTCTKKEQVKCANCGDKHKAWTRKCVAHPFSAKLKDARIKIKASKNFGTRSFAEIASGISKPVGNVSAPSGVRSFNTVATQTQKFESIATQTDPADFADFNTGSSAEASDKHRVLSKNLVEAMSALASATRPKLSELRTLCKAVSPEQLHESSRAEFTKLGKLAHRRQGIPWDRGARGPSIQDETHVLSQEPTSQEARPLSVPTSSSLSLSPLAKASADSSFSNLKESKREALTQESPTSTMLSDDVMKFEDPSDSSYDGKWN